jgi:hypothetical protein
MYVCIDFKKFLTTAVFDKILRIPLKEFSISKNNFIKDREEGIRKEKRERQ